MYARMLLDGADQAELTPAPGGAITPPGKTHPVGDVGFVLLQPGKLYASSFPPDGATG